MAGQVDCITNKYPGGDIAQLFGPFGIIAQTADGKAHNCLADAIAHVKPKPPPEPDHVADVPKVDPPEPPKE